MTLELSSPFFYIGTRMISAGIILYILDYFFTQQKNKIVLTIQDWKLLIQASFFSIIIAYSADLWSLQYLTCLESSLIFNTSPFLAALFSYMWFKESMTKKKWLGLLLGILSIIPVVCKESFLSFELYHFLPIVVLLIGVISSSYGWIIIRELVKNRKVQPLLINSIIMFFGGLITLTVSYCIESWSPSPVQSWKDFIFLTCTIIIVANILFSNFYTYLLKKYTATLLSFAGFLCPIFTAFLSWIFLAEPFAIKFLFSFFMVTIGLYLFYQEELRQGYIT